MEIDKSEVISVLRAISISCKESISLQKCEKDYREVQGVPIPYKKLGFKTLKSFLETIPGFILRDMPDGTCTINVTPSEKSKNIAQLVARQKTAKKPVKHFNMPQRRPRDSWTPGYSSETWKYSQPQISPKGYYKPMSTSPKKNLKVTFTTGKSVSNFDEINKVNKNTQPNRVIQNFGNTLQNTLLGPRFNNPPNHSTLGPRFNNLPNQPTLAPRFNDQPKTSNKAINNSIPISNNKKAIVRTSAADRMNALQSKLQEQVTVIDKTEEIRQQVLQLTIDNSFKENKTRLFKHCQLMNLPEPVFITHENKRKGRNPPTFDCNVKIGKEHSFSTYPDSLSSLELAIETAAKKALNHLHSLAKQKDIKTTTSPDVALNRIEKLVSTYPSGLFVNRLSSIYEDSYKDEILPSNWFDIIKKSDSIALEETVSGVIILIHVDKPPPLLSSPSLDSNEEEEEENLPPYLEYPEDSHWSVFVMSANSTIEIWVRIIGEQYSSAYESLTAKMNLYFTEKLKPSNNVASGGWFALKYEDGWLRTRVLETNGNRALCFLVDTGDEEYHTFDDLYDLPNQFLSLAPQAILCRLAGLEAFSLINRTHGVDLSDILVDKVLIAEVHQELENTLLDDPTITVVLYDTSTEEDLNLNKIIIHRLTQEVKTPQLSPGIIEIYISDVNPDGTIYAQVHNENWNLLQKMIEGVVSGPFPKEALQASLGPIKPTPNVYYLVKSTSGEWMRAVVLSEVMTSVNGESVVTAKYVDTGVTETISVKDMILLDRLSVALNSFPEQVLNLKLNNVPYLQEELLECLNKLLPRNTPVLCKQVSPGSNSAEIFVRTQPHNILCNINNAINMEIELSMKRTNKDVSDPFALLTKKKERIFSTLSNPVRNFKTISDNSNENIISPFKLPEKGACFNVYVTLASNPSNFVVQSLDFCDDLEKMMSRLQQVSESPRLTSPPTIGAVYAAYHKKDQYWYRVYVQGLISQDTASIYFCDYGDLDMIDITNLRELPSDCKNLPVQAIKAKLYGVSPINADWSVNDCLRFQEIVVEKKFASIVDNIEQDPLHKNELLLTLNLIDTSTDADVYINDKFFKEGRAKLI